MTLGWLRLRSSIPCSRVHGNWSGHEIRSMGTYLSIWVCPATHRSPDSSPGLRRTTLITQRVVNSRSTHSPGNQSSHPPGWGRTPLDSYRSPPSDGAAVSSVDIVNVPEGKKRTWTFSKWCLFVSIIGLAKERLNVIIVATIRSQSLQLFTCNNNKRREEIWDHL